MRAINMLSFFRKTFSIRLRTPTLLLKHIQQNFYKTKQTSFDFKSLVKNDVTIFQLENPNFFVAINFFSATQCAAWTYLGVFLFQEIRKSASYNSDGKNWLKIMEKERKYGDILSAIFIFFGWAMFLGTLFYSFRSVRKIILHKGGKDITLVTYNFPRFNTITVPLSNVSSAESRIKAKKYIPIKLKNKYFYYLVDIRGNFSNPTLFDYTAGVKRVLY